MLRFIQDRIGCGLLDARIQFVFSNRAYGEAEGSDKFFKLVESYALPLVTCSSASFRRSRRSAAGSRVPWAKLRPEFDRLILESLKDYRPDICVLAGYMLIVGGEMCRRYPLLNLHPALPDGPIGTWQEVIWELIGQRAGRTGAMIHLATEEVDRGPVLSYCTAPITGPGFDQAWKAMDGLDLGEVKAAQGEEFPLFQQIRQAEYNREPYLILETLRAVADGRIVIHDGQGFDAGGTSLAAESPHGLCLDGEIDRARAADGVS